MATANLNRFIRGLTRGMLAETLRERSDRELVEQFLSHQDEAVFEVLVRRHGPMVYRVCWRVLQQTQDTEDAFQATFLLLAQKLRTVRKLDSLASWLHGVARRVALKARAQIGMRQRHEQRAPLPRTTLSDEITWSELRTVLDAELGRLPEKWRLPLILTYLEGRTQEEAARQLRWSKNTLCRRLAEARAVFGRRLTWRGASLPAVFSVTLLSECVASAALPARLIHATVEAAVCTGTAPALAAGLISAKVAALTEGALKAMFVTRLKTATTILLALSIVGTSAGLVARHVLAEPARAKKEKPAEQVEQVERVLHAVDADKHRIAIISTIKDKASGQKSQKTFTFEVTADTRIVVARPAKEGNKSARLADLKEGMAVTVALAADRKTATSIRAAQKRTTKTGALAAVDAEKNTITISTKDRDNLQKQQLTLSLARDARITLAQHDKKGELPINFADLKAGMTVMVQLAEDQATVVAIHAAAPTARGVVKAVDVARNQITVTVGAKDRATDIVYVVEKDAKISLNDSDGKLSDLKEGAPILLQLSARDGGVVGIQVGEKKKDKSK